MYFPSPSSFLILSHSKRYLPVTIVASFVKKLLRLSLTAPPPSALLCIEMCYHILYAYAFFFNSYFQNSSFFLLIACIYITIETCQIAHSTIIFNHVYHLHNTAINSHNSFSRRSTLRCRVANAVATSAM